MSWTDDREELQLPPTGDPWDPAARPTFGFAGERARLRDGRRLAGSVIATLAAMQAVSTVSFVRAGWEVGSAPWVVAGVCLAIAFALRGRLATPETRFAPVIALLGGVAALLAALAGPLT